MKLRRQPRNAVKNSLDNLPSGICIFKQNGLPLLCNRQMHRLVFSIGGRDLQMLSDLTDALASPNGESGVRCDGDLYLLPDGTVWHFVKNQIIADGKEYIEYIASDVTELSHKRELLKKSTAEHDKMVSNMKQIVDNVTAITREEEILTMKMHIHNKTGWCLQRIRQFYLGGCLPSEKSSLVEMLGKTAGALEGEIGNDDEIDTLAELVRIASGLGVSVDVKGILPEDEHIKSLAVAAIRECITNAVRHAGGSGVTAEFTQRGNAVKITNNGKPPEKEVTEGGGLSYLRQHIENSGGMMTVQSLPEFALEIEFAPKSERRSETDDKCVDC